VVDKSRNNAFAGTTLASDLRSRGAGAVVLVGFTTNLCVDATARSAHDEGFDVYVLSDATATFDRVGPDGREHKADALHAACLATLHQEYAVVLEAAALFANV
jgi:nicotinamidase-related amidase